MPNAKRKYNKYRPRRRRNYRRRRKVYKRKASLNVIPTSLVKRFRYVTDISIDPVGPGIMASHVFRANSMYDPDQSGVGHQPYGFDQYVPQLYNHATVLGSKITAVFSLGNPAVINAQNNIICGLSLLDNATPQTNPSLVREQGGYCSWTMVTNAQQPRRKSLKYSAKKFHGVKDVKDNQQLQHSADGDPTEGAYFHLWAAPSAYNVDASNVLIQVIIDYIALLQEPNTFGQS